MAKPKNPCGGSGARLNLSAAEAERSEVRCPDCGRWLKMRKGYAGGVGRGERGWPETTVPHHNKPSTWAGVQ